MTEKYISEIETSSKIVTNKDNKSKLIVNKPGLKRKIVQNIHEEDKYLEHLDKIIQRDFFPDLDQLRASSDFLDAVEKKDVDRMHKIQRELSRMNTNRTCNDYPVDTPGTFDTPVPTSSSGDPITDFIAAARKKLDDELLAHNPEKKAGDSIDDSTAANVVFLGDKIVQAVMSNHKNVNEMPIKEENVVYNDVEGLTIQSSEDKCQLEIEPAEIKKECIIQDDPVFHQETSSLDTRITNIQADINSKSSSECLLTTNDIKVKQEYVPDDAVINSNKTPGRDISLPKEQIDPPISSTAMHILSQIENSLAQIDNHSERPSDVESGELTDSLSTFSDEVHPWQLRLPLNLTRYKSTIKTASERITSEVTECVLPRLHSSYLELKVLAVVKEDASDLSVSDQARFAESLLSRIASLISKANIGSSTNYVTTDYLDNLQSMVPKLQVQLPDLLFDWQCYKRDIVTVNSSSLVTKKEVRPALKSEQHVLTTKSKTPETKRSRQSHQGTETKFLHNSTLSYRNESYSNSRDKDLRKAKRINDRQVATDKNVIPESDNSIFVDEKIRRKLKSFSSVSKLAHRLGPIKHDNFQIEDSSIDTDKFKTKCLTHHTSHSFSNKLNSINKAANYTPRSKRFISPQSSRYQDSLDDLDSRLDSSTDKRVFSRSYNRRNTDSIKSVKSTDYHVSDVKYENLGDSYDTNYDDNKHHQRDVSRHERHSYLSEERYKPKSNYYSDPHNLPSHSRGSSSKQPYYKSSNLRKSRKYDSIDRDNSRIDSYYKTKRATSNDDVYASNFRDKRSDKISSRRYDYDLNLPENDHHDVSYIDSKMRGSSYVHNSSPSRSRTKRRYDDIQHEYDPHESDERHQREIYEALLAEYYSRYGVHYYDVHAQSVASRSDLQDNPSETRPYTTSYPTSSDHAHHSSHSNILDSHKYNNVPGSLPKRRKTDTYEQSPDRHLSRSEFEAYLRSRSRKFNLKNYPLLQYEEKTAIYGYPVDKYLDDSRLLDISCMRRSDVDSPPSSHRSRSPSRSKLIGYRRSGISNPRDRDYRL